MATITLRVTTSVHYTFEVEAESAAAAIEQWCEHENLPDEYRESDSWDIEAIDPNTGEPIPQTDNVVLVKGA